MKNPRQHMHRIPIGLLTVVMLVVAADRGRGSASGVAVLGAFQEEHQWDLEAPGPVSIDQALETLGVDARHRVSMRMGPLVSSGLLSLGLEALPEDNLKTYEEFIEESGMDPVEQVTGMVLYADGDITDFESSDPTMVFGVRDEEELLSLFSYIGKVGDDKERDEEAAMEFMTMVCLLTGGVEDREAFIEVMTTVGEDSPPYITAELADASIAYRVNDDEIDYAYLWAGGIMMSTCALGDETPEEVVQEELSSLLGELADAAETKVKRSETGIVLEGYGEAEGQDAEFDLYITDVTTLSITWELSEETVAGAEQFVASLPVIRASPELLASAAPPEYLELIEMLINGSQVTIEDDELVIEVEIANEEIEDVLSNL